MTSNVFNDYAHFYNALYRDKNYEFESEWIASRLKLNMIRESLPKPDSLVGHKRPSILELGSGTGIHGQQLSQKGFFVYGIEASEAMALQAKQSKFFKILVADASQFVSDMKFDACISMFHVLSYLTSRDKQESLFNNVRRQLPKGAPFMFDVWYGPAVISQEIASKTKQVTDRDYKILRRSTPKLRLGDQIVDVDIELSVLDSLTNQVQEIKETHSMFYYFEEDISNLASACGFEVVDARESFTDTPLSNQTWSACWTLV